MHGKLKGLTLPHICIACDLPHARAGDGYGLFQLSDMLISKEMKHREAVF